MLMMHLASLIQFQVLMKVITVCYFPLHTFSLGNPYSTQAPSGHLKCPTPPPSKSQSLSRKHSIELGQVGLLSPAALSPMQSESTFNLWSLIPTPYAWQKTTGLKI